MGRRSSGRSRRPGFARTGNFLRQNAPEAGYTVVESQFALPPRFLVEKRGLEFVFNSNEISQERGEPAQLIVPWGEISSLIRREIGVVPVP